MNNEPFYPCQECKVGTLHRDYAFFFTIQGGQPICVPDFPAWTCDLCGRRDYDSVALTKLQAIFETDRRSRQEQHQSPKIADQDHTSVPVDPQVHI
ncbi:MAG: YgiT-type zinc finger protein [Anaerolineales bacterium]|nr:YgiT-type zinc finger protein [Anaerolineales bacterium]